MSNHLLEYIEIKDFKCFKDFKAEGFKRVNLIGGKNNVGKTAFMEACYINVYSLNIDNMTNAIGEISFVRELLEYVLENPTKKIQKAIFDRIKYYKANSNQNNITYNVTNSNGIKEYNFCINDKIIKINNNDFSYLGKSINSINFISNYGIKNSMFKDIFEEVQKKDMEETLCKFINEFDNNILNFKILGGDKPACKVINGDEYRDINEFGDGLKHYISIICSLYACENGYLFIDEIDNGIHYTQLDKLWEIILTISKEQNVQVFATTHSKECIESYARVSEKLEDEDVSFISLYRDKKNTLKSITFNNEEIQTRQELGLDNR